MENSRGYGEAWDTYGVRVVQLASTAQGEHLVREWSDDAARSGDEAVRARYANALQAGLELRSANRAYRQAVKAGPQTARRAATARALGLVKHGFRGESRSWETDDGQVQAAVGAVVVEEEQRWTDSQGKGWAVSAGVYEVTLTEQVDGQHGVVRGMGRQIGEQPSGVSEFEVPVEGFRSAQDGGTILGGGVFVQYRGLKATGRGAQRRFEYPGPPATTTSEAGAGSAA